MPLSLYNTLTRRVEPFEPLAPPRVTLYSCGPTVYNYAHIGNFRTFLFVDLLRRWLEASGYDVYHIMNFTDVDDKIIKAAVEKRVSIRELTEPYAAAFLEDRDYLGVVPAHVYPRATDFIPAMIKLVAGLLDKGTAYRGEDGSVYFGIDRFANYGQLSQLAKRELRAGAGGRTSADEYTKENVQDFVLWKSVRPEDEQAEAAWDAPFGRGRPGWHLECSAMALDLIGERFGAQVLDIHTGGVDLIFPHHEDEIAQSCAFTGEPLFARYWLHGEFLNIRGSKMSKRFGNITTPRDLRTDGVEAAAIRLMMLQTHYRQQLDLTDEGLAAAREGARRLGECADRFDLAGVSKGPGVQGWAEPAARLEADFRSALDDDLNGPRALAAVFDFVRDANRLLDEGVVPSASAKSSWDLAMRVSGAAHRAQGRAEISGSAEDSDGSALAESPPAGASGRLAWGTRWANRRAGAKRRRDFPAADEIRDRLVQGLFEIRDRRDGSAELVDRGSSAAEQSPN